MKKLFLTAPTFNQSAAESAVKGFITPIINFGLVIVPLLAIAAAIFVGVKYFMDDEHEREQKPLWKRLKPIIIAALIVQSLQLIFKIFGLAA